MIDPRKVSVYLLNETEAGSSYYAVTQFIRNIIGFDIKIHSTVPKFFFRLYLDKMPKNKYGRTLFRMMYYLLQWIRATYMILEDIFFRKPEKIIICREIFTDLVPFYIKPFFKKLIKDKKVIWTIDDHIFESKEISAFESNLLYRFASQIIVPNEYLKEIIAKKTNAEIFIVHPTDGDISLDLHRNSEETRRKYYNTEITIVWVGTSNSIEYLKNVVHALDEGAKVLKDRYNKKCKLVVVSNAELSIETQNIEIKNIQWERKETIRQMSNAHIGIMPLNKNNYTLGKSGCKLVQYLTAGLPSIASFVGYNENIIDEGYGFLINDSEDHHLWTEALIELSIDWDRWNDFSKKAFNASQKNFSYEKDLAIWGKILN